MIQEGYDPVYGARPLKRAIQTMIQNPLAVKLLKGEIGGGQSVKASAKDGHIVFSSEETGQKAAVS